MEINIVTLFPVCRTYLQNAWLTAVETQMATTGQCFTDQFTIKITKLTLK